MSGNFKRCKDKQCGVIGSIRGTSFIIIIIILTYLYRMTISVIETAINMGPVFTTQRTARTLHTKDSHSTGITLLSWIVRGFFNVPQNYQHSRNCETGPPAYRPYPRRLESLTICRWNYKSSTFLLSYLKTLSVGPVGVSNSRPPASQPGAQPSEPHEQLCFAILQ